jgi:DNA polymerase-1
MSAYGLAQQLNIEPKIAQAYIDEYFKKVPGVRAYIEKVSRRPGRKDM